MGSLTSLSLRRLLALEQRQCFSNRIICHPVLLSTTSSSSLRFFSSDNTTTAGNNSNQPPPQPPYRFLRRPGMLRRDANVPPQKFSLRNNAISIFPGDYGTDEDDFYDNPFEDDDDDIFSNKASSTTTLEDEAQASFVEELRRREEESIAKRERWLELGKKPLRVSEIDERGRAYGRGARKRAQARVWIQAGFGQVVINRRPFVDYFRRQSDRDLILQPLVATETAGAFDLQVTVKGGGLTGQAGAIRHGLANALNKYNPDKYRPPLKLLGFLERDARRVERKKVGHVKARKSPQWVRR